MNVYCKNLFSGLSRKLVLTFFFLFVILLGGSFQPIASDIADSPLRIMFTGNWEGKYLPKNTQGGVATLHTLIQQNKRQIRAENGDLLYLFAGDFTGATSHKEFLQKLIFPQLKLFDYLKFDAILLSPPELSSFVNLKKNEFQKHFQKAPIISFNHRNLKIKKHKTRPYQIIPTSKSNIMVTAISNGPEPTFDSQPLSRLFLEIKRQSGIDLLIILMSDKARQDTSEKNDSFFHVRKNNFIATQLLHEQKLYKFYIGKKSSHTDYVSHSHFNTLQNKTLVLISGSTKNKFYRHNAGPYICETKSRMVCRINLLLRNKGGKKELVGLDQDFIDMNDPKYTKINSDRLLYKTLSQ